LLLQIDHADEALSDWAVEDTPLFGSNDTATDASQILNAFSFAAFGATALATPSGSRTEGWTSSKLKGIGIQTSALLLTLGSTELLKTVTERTRPNEDDNKSFPSGHISTAAANSMLACRNTDLLRIPVWRKNTLKTGFFLWCHTSPDGHALKGGTTIPPMYFSAQRSETFSGPSLTMPFSASTPPMIYSWFWTFNPAKPSPSA